MKAEKFAACLMGVLLALLLSCGAMGAMISGLDLPVADMGRLYLAFAAAALAGSLLSLPRRGYIPTLLLTAAAGWYVWKYQDMALPLRALVTRLSFLYDSAYGWGVVEFAGVPWQTVELDLALGAMGCLIALTAAGTVVSGRGTVAAAGLSLLPLGAAVVVTNTVPDPVPLYLMMLGMILLLLTASVRRHSPGQGAKLAALTALPVAALLAALFLAFPKDTYVNRTEEFLDEVAGWWANEVSTLWNTSGLLGQTGAAADQTASTNLSLIGRRAQWRYAVMDVTAGESGVLYLRGQSYDFYDGANWTADPEAQSYFAGGTATGTAVTVVTRRDANVIYLPYYPAEGVLLTGGRLANPSGRREYTIPVARVELPGSAVIPWTETEEQIVAGAEEAPASGLIELPGQIIRDVGSQELPDGTRLWAEDFVNGILTNQGTNTEIARQVGEYVRNCARYDTNTGRMDPAYSDFARWFLEESETGYCVHFATAATVLLRAAGIPARYVTGYMTECTAGRTVTVRADDAHAWVEYFEPLVGTWMILEATPADLSEEATQREETEGTEGTQPPTTQPTEPPTQPSGESRPNGETRPTQKPQQSVDLTPLRQAAGWLLAAAAVWLAAEGQYRLRRRSPGGGANARALALWQQVERLCRATRQTPPQALLALAEKAKFSRHTLTDAEVAAFEDWLGTQREKLKQSPWYLRLAYRYVFVLW